MSDRERRRRPSPLPEAPTRREVREAIADVGWIPPKRELDQVLDLAADPELGVHAVRAAVRAGKGGADAAVKRFPDASEDLRPALLDVVGRVAGQDGDLTHLPLLLESLQDDHVKTRRAALRSLSRLGGASRGSSLPEAVEEALMAAWTRASELPEQRAVVRALSALGGARTSQLLRSITTSDPELRRLVDEGLAKVQRTAFRPASSVLSPSRLEAPVEVRLAVRNGLEPVLRQELDELGVELANDTGEPAGTVVVRVRDFAPLLRARVALHFGIVVPLRGKGGSSKGTLATRLVEALRAVVPLMKAWTSERPIRYRLEWVGQGHRRAQTFQVAKAIDSALPELRNDPVESPWELRVRSVAAPGDEERLIDLELHPRGVRDERFTYRVASVPAATHPTVAAALVRAAGVDMDDVVWDPFVGSAVELIERARLGPYRRLYGSDRDARALEAARANVDAAGVSAILAEAELGAGRPPEKVSLVLTNPPMGRRVLDRASLTPLFERFFAYVPQAMADRSRIAWYSPLPDLSIELAQAAGFEPLVRRMVDLSGMLVEQQVLVRRTSKGRGRGSRPSRPRTG